jgi:hypothetical protein
LSLRGREGPGKTISQAPGDRREDAHDTVIVPASKREIITVNKSNPISAITTYAKLGRIEP